MKSQLETLARHYKYFARLNVNMLLPTITALELTCRTMKFPAT